MTYAFLAENRSEEELVRLDAALSPAPEHVRDEARDRANMREMQRLKDFMGGMGPPQMPPRRSN
jgi:hypothetical protein